MNRELAAWIKSRPGPFAARTHEMVWRMAWNNFNAGPTGNLRSELMFLIYVQEAGFGIRTLTIGGYALDGIE